MAKIVKAWVETNERVDGRKFYTAHVKYRGIFFWVIPYYFVENVVKVHDNPPSFMLQSKSSFYEAHEFKSKDLAEEILLEEIDKSLDAQAEKRARKVIKKTKEVVNLCPINDPGCL